MINDPLFWLLAVMCFINLGCVLWCSKDIQKLCDMHLDLMDITEESMNLKIDLLRAELADIDASGGEVKG